MTPRAGPPPTFQHYHIVSDSEDVHTVDNPVSARIIRREFLQDEQVAHVIPCTSDDPNCFLLDPGRVTSPCHHDRAPGCRVTRAEERHHVRPDSQRLPF